MKSFKNAIVKGITALCLCLPFTGSAVLAEENDTWKTNKYTSSDTLDENYEAEVTLSLPRKEVQIATDVVFVLDKSTSATLENQALTMLSELKKQVETTNAKVNVCVVIFNKVANVMNDGKFFDLATEYDEIEAAIKTEISSGTNTHAGLLAGKAMLDADKTVDADRKYLIFVSDGITYMYNSEPTVTAWSFNLPNVAGDWHGTGSWDTFAGPDNWNSKYHTNEAPADWNTWLKEIGANVETQGTTYEYPYGGTVTTYTAQDIDNWDTEYAMSIDKALYLTYQVYQEAKTAGYKCYAMTAETSSAAADPWGPSFMSYLAGEQSVDFSKIQNDILYYLSAGSTVKDVMGKGTDDQGNVYDFDFVNDASVLSISVGGETISATLVSSDKTSTTYSFGESYTLTYYPNGSDNDGNEDFVWKINTNVTITNPVSLTYKVKLTNPQAATTEEKTYTGLKTNNSAVVTPKDSAGNTDTDVEFPVPEVSYTVAKTDPTPEPTVTPTPTPSAKPSSGKITGTPAGDVTPTSTPSATKTSYQPVDTSTKSDMYLWFGVAGAAIVACIGFVVVRKKLS